MNALSRVSTFAGTDPDLRFLGITPDEIGSGLASVVDGVLARGTPEPAWIAVDDGTDGWVAEAAGCSDPERACGVVATLADHSLVNAQRLGIGGAMWLPPSSLGAQQAFAAAKSAEAPAEGYDAGLAEALDDGAAAVILSFVDRQFWRAQLGERRLAKLLTELAAALNAPAAILPWPALVVREKEPDEVVETLRAFYSDADRAVPDIVVAPLAESASGDGTVAAAYRQLLEDRPPIAVVGAVGRLQPVHELPHGRRVGWWSCQRGRTSPDDSWLLSPEPGSQQRRRWRLDGPEGAGVVEEVLTRDEVDRVQESMAVRVPGWASRDIRAGTPAGLLATRLAEAAERRGLPLWIPNLDGDALKLVLGLPGVLWVDGPAVPR
jgi:hypothetical protein